MQVRSAIVVEIFLITTGVARELATAWMAAEPSAQADSEWGSGCNVVANTDGEQHIDVAI